MTLRKIYSASNEQKNGIFTQKTPVISFEIFPPKNDVDGSKLDKLIYHLDILKKYNPAFISLTYGAGGTNQDFSLDIIKRIQNELKLTVMPHFTCVGASEESVKAYLNEIQSLSLKSILALRGDIPEEMEQTNFDFKYANELVDFIKAHTFLSIGVAGYPEGHIDCIDLSIDLANLKRKVDAGADAIYTQMFFDNDKFLDFVQRARKAGISVPIIPGILPIMSFAQFERMMSMARVSVPKSLLNKLEKFKDNNDYIKAVGVEFASNQCQQLIDNDVAGLHFYTLNTSSAVGQILENLALTHNVLM
jgi:methylenetetrahydrofolate reductase (NADPH)